MVSDPTRDRAIANSDTPIILHTIVLAICRVCRIASSLVTGPYNSRLRSK
jgi:hypothetical protein